MAAMVSEKLQRVVVVVIAVVLDPSYHRRRHPSLRTMSVSGAVARLAPEVVLATSEGQGCNGAGDENNVTRWFPQISNVFQVFFSHELSEAQRLKKPLPT